MGGILETSLPMVALWKALRQRRPSDEVTFHLDHGCQYAGEAYREQLAASNMTPSMSRRGIGYDHAVIESFGSTLNEELVHRRAFVRRVEGADAIFGYINTFATRERP